MQGEVAMRRTFPALVFLAALALSGLAATEPDVERLYRGFQDPPHTYSIRPFWFWNGKLDAREIEWQIDQMVYQGVYGAYLHNRAGLETPYLSEDYFRMIGAGLEKSRKAGFLFGIIDEYEWPSGEARDIWIQGLPSRVVAADSSFRLRSLAYLENDVPGPSRVETEAVTDPQFALAARLADGSHLEPGTLRDISSGIAGNRLHWEAPEGNWRTWLFHLQPSQGRDGGLVDLLNAAAVRKYLDLSYEQYYRRFPDHFGKTFDSTYADHEGDYGYRIAWTPQLFDTFRKMKGYDLRTELPLLFIDGGKRTPKVRCDYLDVVSQLYADSFFKQVADWCDAHHIKISGHVWEETLPMEAAFEGDLQRIMRAWSWPGVDELWDKGRSPRDFKATASVAHFRGTRFTCENQGLQGADSYLDFQKMRLGTNMIAAWGANLFIPHAFNYNRTRIEWPPDWFYHQPWWKYFRTYADYTRRLSYMNDGGRHVADILLFQPTESAWAHIDPAFNAKAPYIGSKLGNPLDAIDAAYTELMNRLAAERRDFDVADSHYLREAAIKGGRLAIGNESFRVLILPPTTTVRRETMRKVREFFEQGGIVIALGRLPTDSMDEGRDDASLLEDVRRVFGEVQSAASRVNSSPAGGKAFFVKEDVGEILGLLEKNSPPDVELLDGERPHLYVLHRQKEGADLYWIVNDSDQARVNSMRFSVRGQAERWDATDASRTLIPSSVDERGTTVRLRFEPWEAYYVVFTGTPATAVPRVVRTNLESVESIVRRGDSVQVTGRVPASDTAGYAELVDAPGKTLRGESTALRAVAPIDLGGSWAFKAENESVPAPYAILKNDPTDEGERFGWHKREFQPRDWDALWLSRERFAVRDWWIVGPFPNEDHRGFSTAYAPERGIDPAASFEGLGGARVGWTRWQPDGYVIDLERVFSKYARQPWMTAYAATWVHVPTARRASFRIAAESNARLRVNGKELLDLHIHPFYYEMREDFAFTREADLQAGWNEVLVKVSKCGHARKYGFVLRVTDADGNNFADLTASTEKKETASTPPRGTRWSRIPVPPTAVGVRFPLIRGVSAIYFDGTEIPLDNSGIARFAAPAEGTGHILALRLRGDGEIGDTPRFLLGAGRLPLGSWVDLGLEHYSGSAAYEREFELNPDQAGQSLVLDCGQVGVVAEVQVNGKPAGARVWLPFRFDITKLTRPGKNRIRIIVTNTMENERAVENHRGQLEKLKLSGLLGPVRIDSYRRVELTCRQQLAK
jgi:hypothetical protein